MRASALVLALLGLARVTAAAPGSIEIRNARLIDGTGAPPRAGVSILVRDGRIARVAEGPLSANIPVLDVGGATVTPGLIDSHVHLAVVPGSSWRGDGPEATAHLRRQQLRAFLACGVTTVLDTGIPVGTAHEIRGWLAQGHPGPTFLTLGPPIAAPGGYMADPRFASVAGSPEELDAAFDAIREAGGVGVKVPIEKGFGPRELWPIHSPAMRDAIAREAAERALPIYVHASSEDEQQIGLEMGAHALVHLDFYAADPSPDFVLRLVRQGTYVMTTFSIMDAELTRWHPERLDDPVVRLAVPETELATARDPEAGAAMARAQVATVFPRLPSILHRVLAWLFVTEAGSRQRLESSQRAALALDRAGALLVVGSDAGNSPEILYQFHGTSTLRELELLAAAGLGPAEVLAAATRVPSRMLGLEREVGTIEAGKRADLLVLRDDPLADVGAFRTALYVVKDGIAHTPGEWRSGVP